MADTLDVEKSNPQIALQRSSVARPTDRVKSTHFRCTGYCTARAYDLPRLLLHPLPGIAMQLYRDVIHAQLKDPQKGKKDLFYFPYGTAVFFGCTEEEERGYLHLLKKFEKEPIDKAEIDEFDFVYGEKLKIEDDTITLPKKDALTKLSVAYAISQSVKLTIFEDTISETIETSKDLPKELAQKGKIPLSRREISRRLGELFLKRNHVNLHSDILDTPEFFWTHADFEPNYRRTLQYLDVTKRVDLLNRRLNLMNELFEILRDELNHKHSTRLDITIISLIVIEVMFNVLRDLLHWI